MFGVNSFIIVVIVQFIISDCVARHLELMFDRVELIPSYAEGYYNFSRIILTKLNRTTPSFNVEFELFVDVDDQVEVDCEFYYKRLNSNQYTKSIMRIRRDKMCHLMEKFSREVFVKNLKNTSNLPAPQPNETICPIKKVRFSKLPYMEIIRSLYL